MTPIRAGTAVGYVRQSKRADLDVALSPEQQEADIRRMAAADGFTPDAVTVYRDLGRSGGAGKERLRSGYQQLVEAIEGGGVAVVYAKALTRLARSVTELYRVLRVAQDRGTVIVTAKEGRMDPTSSIGKAQFGMLAVFAEFERDLAVERAKDNAATRRARGERMGRVPYGDRPGDRPDAVIEAWRSTRSLDGAAKWLNDRGVLPWKREQRDPITGVMGPGQWSGPGVRAVLNRIAPGTVSRLSPKRGVKPAGRFTLYQLLRCHCGRTMTASRDGRGNRDAVYRCHVATTLKEHGKPYRLQEGDVMPWVMAEAARLRVPGDVAEVEAGNETRRAELGAKRDGIGDAYAAGAYGPVGSPSAKAAMADRLARLETELDGLAASSAMVDIPEAIDWGAWSPGAINDVLRALWSHVELDAELRPVRAEWKLPAEYVAAIGD